MSDIVIEGELHGRPSDKRMMAAAAIVFFYLFVLGALIWFILGEDNQIGGDKWDQVVVLITAIGTLATGAAGILFGVKMQDQHAKAASNRAERAEKEVVNQAKKIEVKNALIKRARSEIREQVESAKVARGARSASESAQEPAERAETLLLDALEA